MADPPRLRIRLFRDHQTLLHREEQALATLDLPLNLHGNRQHPFHTTLVSIQAEARGCARSLPLTV